MAWTCQMARGNNRIWFYVTAMTFCVLVASILLFSSRVNKRFHNPSFRKFVEDLGYAFLGSTIFAVLAIVYEVCKDNEPEILNIIQTLNNESSIVGIHNDLFPTQTSRSAEVVRMMRENSRNRALERIRLRALNRENRTNTSVQDQNCDQQDIQDSVITARAIEAPESTTQRQDSNNEDFNSRNSNKA